MSLLEENKAAPVSRDERVSNLPEPRRLEGLSDAAFSIIITLLVLEIHRPNAAPSHRGAELLLEWPSYLAYAVAFVFIGVVWLNHHYIFERLCNVDLTWRPDGSEGSGFTLCLDCRAGGGGLVAGFSHSSRHPELLKPNLPPGIFASQVKRLATAIVCQILAAALRWFVHPILAVAPFTFVVLYHAWNSQGIPSGR
ncbi:MAG TPA: TMEM175 family protein [Bryobacteraceae bacterium]|nr:TMEM175 family protein [Bryobacteraceae bacterium]